MIITSNVSGIITDIDREEILIELKFSAVALEYSYKEELLCVEYDKDGNIINFSSLGDSPDCNSIKHIATIETVKKALALEESEHIKEIYNKSVEIYKAYKKEEGNEELYRKMLKSLSLLKVVI